MFMLGVPQKQQLNKQSFGDETLGEEAHLVNTGLHTPCLTSLLFESDKSLNFWVYLSRCASVILLTVKASLQSLKL